MTLAYYTHDSWRYLTQPPTPTLPPLFQRNVSLGEHMERRGEKNARRRLLLGFLVKQKDWEPTLCVFFCLFGGFCLFVCLFFVSLWVGSQVLRLKKRGSPTRTLSVKRQTPATDRGGRGMESHKEGWCPQVRQTTAPTRYSWAPRVGVGPFSFPRRLPGCQEGERG